MNKNILKYKYQSCALAVHETVTQFTIEIWNISLFKYKLSLSLPVI